MKKLFHTIRPGEGRIVFMLLILLAINTLMLEMAEVVATAGFISNVGTPQIVALWVVDVVITLIAASGFALIVDRLRRDKLVSWMLLFSGIIYLGLLLLFVFQIPGWISYTLLYILSDQQYVVFPLAFWALTNDIYSLTEGKRLFPIIAAGSAIGNLLGNGLAALSDIFFTSLDYELLIINVILCLVGWIIVKLFFKKYPLRSRQSHIKVESWRETLKGGSDTIWNVPLFRYLAMAMFAAGICLAILEYHFLVSIDSLASNQSFNLATVYAIFKLMLFSAILVFQWFITSRWMEKLGTKQTFIILPLGMALSIIGVFFQPLLGAIAARFIARLLQTAWDEPARKSVQGLVPDERRGRVSVVLDSYCYALATIVGCAVLGILIGLKFSGLFSAAVVTYIYLGTAICAAAIGVWAALRIRSVYDTSLLNWRLARSRRRSVLDGIEF